MLADFEQTMQLAAQESERHERRYLGTEHALLGLLRTSNAPAVSVLRSRGLTAEAVEVELARLEAEGVVPRDGGRELLRGLGIDIEEVVARLDRSFGRAAVDEATCRVARRRWWRRSRRVFAPLAKPVLLKRARSSSPNGTRGRPDASRRRSTTSSSASSATQRIRSGRNAAAAASPRSRNSLLYRNAVTEGTGQPLSPAIQFEDGSWYWDESKEMARTIRDGRLREKQQGGGAATP